MSIGTQLRRAIGRIGDIVFPPVCLGCGELAGSHGGLCGSCWSRLRAIEAPVCDVLGTPLAYDAGKGVLSADAIANPPPFAKARSAVVYDDMARAMVHRLKYKDRTDLAKVMARWMMRAGGDVIGACDAIVPVPLHRRRLLTRRYNQAAELARALAPLAGLTYLPAALYRTRATRQQVGLGTQARADNVRGAFSVSAHGRSQITGRSVLLVDDVYTTGATVKSASRALLKAGADHVYVLTFARVAPGAS
ncbi:ComF family protein [Hoeflea sp. E7-10]|uniref:ComF family protein n=2 Tax=Hoeflea poritis TaxID=2993659 RepID=A0ABT4VMF0_9HYPH|nr:ComF family protein [Hoeflea poritis]MDA4845845.1 ComF family protein [Hoeflea poritis]